MAIRIRRATPADEAAIDLWQQNMEHLEEFLGPVAAAAVRDSEVVLKRFAERLRLPREQKIPRGWERIDLVAVEENGAICGYAALLFGQVDQLTGAPEAHISELHVWPDYRHRGVAKGLLEMSDAYALQRGIPYLTLNVPAGNAAAIQLYQSAGFREETVRMTKRVGR